MCVCVIDRKRGRGRESERERERGTKSLGTDRSRETPACTAVVRLEDVPPPEGLSCWASHLWQSCIASAAAVASSSRDALAMSMPVMSHTMVW